MIRVLCPILSSSVCPILKYDCSDMIVKTFESEENRLNAYGIVLFHYAICLRIEHTSISYFNTKYVMSLLFWSNVYKCFNSIIALYCHDKPCNGIMDMSYYYTGMTIWSKSFIIIAWLWIQWFLLVIDTPCMDEGYNYGFINGVNYLRFKFD